MSTKIEILSIPVCNVDMEEAKSSILAYMKDGKSHIIATANAEMIMIAQKDNELAHILQNADMVVPDGAGVLWAAEQQGQAFKERVAGYDLANKMLEEAVKEGFSVYLFGGGDGIADTAVRRCQEIYGKLNIVGFHSGFFSLAEEKDIIKEIRDSGAKLVLVALGVPKQEKWIAAHLRELGACTCIGVGGTLDILAGRATRAPAWMQHHRLEWLYRLGKEPSRFVRMLALPHFVWKVWRSIRNEHR